MKYVRFILACSGEYCTQQNVQVNPPYLKIYLDLSKIFKSIINQMIFKFLLPQVPVYQIKYCEKCLKVCGEKHRPVTYRKLGYGRNVLRRIVLITIRERTESFHLRDFYID